MLLPADRGVRRGAVAHQNPVRWKVGARAGGTNREIRAINVDDRHGDSTTVWFIQRTGQPLLIQEGSRERGTGLQDELDSGVTDSRVGDGFLKSLLQLLLRVDQLGPAVKARLLEAVAETVSRVLDGLLQKVAKLDCCQRRLLRVRGAHGRPCEVAAVQRDCVLVMAPALQ